MLPETSSSIVNEQQLNSSNLETKAEMCTLSMQNLKPQSKIDLQPTNASVSIVEDSSKAEIPFPAKAQHSSSRKLRRSATTISSPKDSKDTIQGNSNEEIKSTPENENERKLRRSATTMSSPKDSKDTIQGNSNEEIKSTPENQNEVLKEPTPIIEVKKPPSYEATWGKSSELVGGISEVETSTNKLDSTCNNLFDAEKQKKSGRDSSNTRIKSSIPRLMKSKPPEKNRILLANEKEKKTVGSPSRIPKTCQSPRPVQSTALNNLSKRSTPNRSRASNISSGMLSPASGATSHRSKSPVSSSPVSCQSVAKNDDTAVRNMLDKMYTTLNKLKDDESYDDNASSCSQGKKQGDKNVDYLLPAKDGAGETISRTDSLDYSEKEPLLKECLINSTADLLERIAKRTDLFHYLSELNNQNQTNLRDLHDIIKHSIKSKGPSDRVDPNQIEMQFYKVEQAQIELVQRLSKAIRQLYDDRERLQEDINKLNVKYQAIPELEDKIAVLQAENTGLLEKVKRITQNLEDEKVISQKRKITTQTVNQLKAKLQKAESKLLQMEKKANDLSTWGKKLEASVKQKESIVEQGSKKMKVIESTLQELEDENNKLKRELEDIKTNEDERFGNLVKNSQELKDAKVELMQAQEKLNEEAARREKVSTKLQDTSAKLKLMEEKCKNLTSLVDSAKAEVKSKQTESAEKETKFTEEISQLTTELQARKVMLKVAENEVGFIKSKLEKLESQSKQEQEKDRSTNEVEEQLKMDLLLRDEQITQLQEQIKVLVEKKFNREPHSKSKNRLTKSAEKSQNTFSERVQLTAQVVDLERTIDALAKDNLQLNQILNQKNLELDQRDRILKMQTDVLKIRDELIWLLKSKETKHEEDIQRLNEIIQERENAISKEWNRALEDNYQANALKKWQKMGESPNDVDPSYGSNEESMYLSGTMYELYSSLEKKQMELEMMQQRVQQLEGLQDTYNQQRTRQEVRSYSGAVDYNIGDQNSAHQHEHSNSYDNSGLQYYYNNENNFGNTVR